MISLFRIASRRLAAFAALLAVPGFLWAEVSNGGVRYDLTAQALYNMTVEVLTTMSYVVGLLYAIASILAIYNATVIYVKLNTGEEGFTKAVVSLVGAVLFLISATLVMPALFGFSYGGGGYG